MCINYIAVEYLIVAGKLIWSGMVRARPSEERKKGFQIFKRKAWKEEVSLEIYMQREAQY